MFLLANFLFPFLFYRFIYTLSRSRTPQVLTNQKNYFSPRDEVTLNSVTGESDPVDVVALTNGGSKDVVYKIKITSPEKFRVRPSTGTVGPGKTEFVRVYLQNGNLVLEFSTLLGLLVMFECQEIFDI